MTVALVFVLALVTPMAAADRLLAGRPGEAALAGAPLGLLLLFAFLAAPSPARVFGDAVEVPRARLARWAGADPRLPLDAIESVYPSYYEDSGMKFSPFASAEGTAKHAGLRVETTDGRGYTIEFTPAVLNLRRKGTPAYRDALAAVRAVREQAGQPMVGRPPALTEQQAEAMLTESARPLLPFPVTVTGVLSPALIIPLLLWGAAQAMGPLPDAAMLALAFVGLLPLFFVFAYVNVRAARRARLLHEVQKWREHRREATDTEG
jgi:hypothetical protein